MNQGDIKVRFELDPSDWHGHGTETLWATPIADLGAFRIANSPFFARGISYRYVVRASPLPGASLFAYQEVLERSGHSTYMLLMNEHESRIESYWSMLVRCGCSFDSMHIDLSIGKRVLYSVDVPPRPDAGDVYEMLRRGEQDRVWMFQEGYAAPSAP